MLFPALVSMCVKSAWNIFSLLQNLQAKFTGTIKSIIEISRKISVGIKGIKGVKDS